MSQVCAEAAVATVGQVAGLALKLVSRHLLEVELFTRKKIGSQAAGWAAGQLGSWAAGQLGSWATRQLGRWVGGQVGNRATGQMGNWVTGQLVDPVI